MKTPLRLLLLIGGFLMLVVVVPIAVECILPPEKGCFSSAYDQTMDGHNLYYFIRKGRVILHIPGFNLTQELYDTRAEEDGTIFLIELDGTKLGDIKIERRRMLITNRHGCREIPRVWHRLPLWLEWMKHRDKAPEVRTMENMRYHGRDSKQGGAYLL